METPAFQPSAQRRLIYLSLFPVIVCELAIFPFWFGGARNNPGVADAQLLVTIFLLPLYLAIVTSICVWRGTFRDMLFAFALLLICIALAVFLAYSAWGLSTGRFWAPDYETLFILRQAGLLAAAVGLIPPLGTLAVRFISQYSHRHA
jgi:hypothetical protein